MPDRDEPLDFLSILTNELRRRPLGTVANVTDFAVAYMREDSVKGIFLRDDGSYIFDDEFDFTDMVIDQWWADLDGWLAFPIFSDSPEIRVRLEVGKI